MKTPDGNKVNTPSTVIAVGDVTCEVFDLRDMRLALLFFKGDLCWAEVIQNNDDRNPDDVIATCMAITKALGDRDGDEELKEFLSMRSLFLAGVAFFVSGKFDDAFLILTSAQSWLDDLLRRKFFSSVSDAVSTTIN